MINSSDIRTQGISNRKSLSQHNRKIFQSLIIRNLRYVLSSLQYKSVSSYIAFGSEVNLDSLDITNYYVPVIHPTLERMMWFIRYDKSSLIQNKYNIYEPNWLSDIEGILSPWELDVIIVPMSAFDDHGYRVGMGGGFYDSSFAWIDDQNIRSEYNTKLIGIAFESQKVDNTFPRNWDLKLDYIVTEHKIREFEHDK